MANKTKSIRASRSQLSNGSARAETGTLLQDAHDALGTAAALARAIELMALGFETLGDDYSTALMTVVEALSHQLDIAKQNHGRLLAETRG